MTAQDEPESVEVLETVRTHANGDPDIRVFSDPADGEAEPVNAFQTLSTIVVQKSIREGFGLTVTEAMWKGAAIAGGNCGIAFQIQDGVNVYLASTPEECAANVAATHYDRWAETYDDPREAKVPAVGIDNLSLNRYSLHSA